MFKRNESFRFTVNPPISGTFRIVRIGEKMINSKPGPMELINISPSGLRMNTELDISYENDVELEVNFILNTVELCFIGNIIWTKKERGAYAYGLNMLNNDAEKERLIEELKIYARTHPQET